MALPPLTYVSWFSGGGGLDLAVRILFPRSVCLGLVEIEAPAVEILAARMEEGSLEKAPIYSDIRTWPGRLYRGRVDLAVFGAPCQPYSAAGKRLGESDERYLWRHIFRAIDECQPALVFLENVPGLLRFYRPIGERLSELGYVSEGLLSSAEEVGAPHKRLRLFVLAYSRCAWSGRPAQPSGVDGGRASDYGSGAGGAVGGSTLFSKRRRDRIIEKRRKTIPDESSVRDCPRCGFPGGFLKEHRCVADPRDRLVPQPGSEPQGRDGAGSAGPELAESPEPGLPLGTDRTGDGGEARRIEAAERRGAELADSAEQRQPGIGSAGYSPGQDGASAPSGGSEELAFPTERGLGELREPSERDGLTAGSGGELEDPARRDGAGSERGLRIGRGVCEAGGELEHSIDGGHEDGRSESRGALRNRSGEDNRSETADGSASLQPPLLFPPHRTGAWEEWQAVLGTHWWLRPALGSFDQFYHSVRRAGLLPVGLAADPVFASEEGQARIAAEVGKALRKAGLSQKIKRVLRPLADGLASALGVSRIDSLRAIGNGVVPEAASLAFVLLAEQLQIGEWDGEQLRIG